MYGSQSRRTIATIRRCALNLNNVSDTTYMPHLDYLQVSQPAGKRDGHCASCSVR